MVDQPDNTTPEVQAETQPTPLAPKVVEISNGEKITLGEHEMAILVSFNPETGVPSVYDVQNTPLRIYSKMLLNEALSLYQLSSVGGTMAQVLEATLGKALADSKKKGFVSPFGK